MVGHGIRIPGALGRLSRGADEAPTPAGPVFEAPRRRDATDWHGKARRARRGRSDACAARATPSVACSSGRPLAPTLLPPPSSRPGSMDPRGAAAAGWLAATPVPARRIRSTQGARRLLLNPTPAVPSATWVTALGKGAASDAAQIYRETSTGLSERLLNAFERYFFPTA